MNQVETVPDVGGQLDTRSSLAAERRRLVAESARVRRSATLSLAIMTAVVAMGATSIFLLVEVDQTVRELGSATADHSVTVQEIDYLSSLLVSAEYRNSMPAAIMAAAEQNMAYFLEDERSQSDAIDAMLDRADTPLFQLLLYDYEGPLNEYRRSRINPELLATAAALPSRIIEQTDEPLNQAELRLRSAVISRDFVAPALRQERIGRLLADEVGERFRLLLTVVLAATVLALALVWLVGFRPALLALRDLTAGLDDHAAEIEHSYVQISAAQRVARLGYWFRPGPSATAGSGGRLECSPELVSLLGLEPDRSPIDLEQLASLLTPGERHNALDAYRRLSAIPGSREFTRSVLTPGGDIRTVRERVESYRAGPSVDMMGVMVDITDMVNAQRVINRMEKFEVINLLVSGVAHDFNNQLAIIMSNAELAMVRGGDLVKRYLSMVISASETASALIEQLRRTTMEPSELAEEFDPLESVRWTVEAFDAVEPGVAIEVADEAAAGITIAANRGLFEASLVNILSNAVDAVDGIDGRITVMVRTESDPERLDGALSLVIEIADNGIGMTERVRSRAMEPFFSTKRSSPKAHVGLGLWSVYCFVNAWHGDIEIASRSNRQEDDTAEADTNGSGVGSGGGSGSNGRSGTTVRLRLPVVTGVGVEPTALPSSRLQRGTALVLEDSGPLGSAIVGILERWVGEVVVVATATEAERVLTGSDNIVLVVADVYIGPQPSGYKVAQLALERHPGIGVVLISGSAVREEVPPVLLGPRSVFLAKPFSSIQLRQALIDVTVAAPSD